MDNSGLMTDLIDVLKDISSFMSKADTEQERAKVQKPPKTGDDQKPIKGAEAPGFKPGEGVAKSLDVTVPDESQENESEEIDENGGTLLKEEDTEFADEETEDEEEDEDSDESEKPLPNFDELKSLLKDIKSALVAKSTVSVTPNVKKAIHAEVNTEVGKMLRKMGFTPSRPDIVPLKFGVENTTDIKKSEDVEKQIGEVEKIVDNWKGKSWGELGNLRENMGLFRPF